MPCLFRCETIAHYRIMRWLQAQGITEADIQSVQRLDAARLKLTNPAGQWMVVAEKDGAVTVQ